MHPTVVLVSRAVFHVVPDPAVITPTIVQCSHAVCYVVSADAIMLPMGMFICVVGHVVPAHTVMHPTMA